MGKKIYFILKPESDFVELHPLLQLRENPCGAFHCRALSLETTKVHGI